MQIQEIIAAVLERTHQAGGLKAVYFVGCGGSQAAIFPGKYLLDCESKTLSVKIYNSNEFVHCPPVKLDGQCLVICCSLKATAETVEAVKTANNAGAVTIAMTGSMETGMAQVGQYIVTYSNGDHQVYSQGNQAQVLRIAFELLHQLEGYAHYEEAMESFGQIDEIIAEAKENMLPAANSLHRNIRRTPCSTCWHAVRFRERDIRWSAAICWRCSVCMPRISTAENISMDRLKQRIGMCR